jgi:hypothetical protein
VLEPEQGHPPAGSGDVVALERVGAAGEQGGPEWSDGGDVGGVQRELELGDGARVRADSLLARDLADPPGQVDVSSGHLGDVVADQLHVDERVRQGHVRMVVGALGGLGDGGHEREAGDEVAGEEPRVDPLGELAPVVEAGFEDLVGVERLHASSMSSLDQVSPRADDRSVTSLPEGSS